MQKSRIMSIFVAILMIAAIFTSCAESTLEDSPDTLLPSGSQKTDAMQAKAQKYEDNVVREYGGVFHDEEFNNICLVKYNDIITVFGTQLLLYPTFVDQNEAITNAAVIMADFLDLLIRESGLAPLSDENWEEYRTAAYNYLENNALSQAEENDFYNDLQYFLGFLDIYENKARNDEIRRVLALYDDTDERMQIKSTLSSEVSDKEQEDLVNGLIFSNVRSLLPDYTIEEFDAIPEVQNILGIYEAGKSGREIKQDLINKMDGSK